MAKSGDLPCAASVLRPNNALSITGWPQGDFLKIGRLPWEILRESVGHHLITARTPSGEDSPISPGCDLNRKVISTGNRASPEHRWGFTACSSSPKISRRCLNSSRALAGCKSVGRRSVFFLFLFFFLQYPYDHMFWKIKSLFITCCNK